MSLASVIRTLAACARRFGAAEQANITILFSLALIPLLGLTGAAVDYTRASAVKTKLNAAADSAALAAVNKSAASMTKSAAEDLAVAVFHANIKNVSDAKLRFVSAKVSDDSNGRSAVVRYKANVPSTIMGVIGIDKMTVGGSATAAASLPAYIDFSLLLDNTPSMGVGARTSDIDTLVANTSDKCAFACHDLSAAPNDYYGLAKNLGVQMRIDVVRQATQSLMDTATATQTVPAQFRMAIYTFGASAQTLGLTTIQSLTSHLATAKTAAANIDLMTVPYQNYASDTDTDFGAVLTKLNADISTPGAGLSASAPQKYVFFVSDGVADRTVGSPACAQPTTNGSDPQTGKAYLRCQEPLDPAFCKVLKDRGIKVAVLYTTYLPLPSNDWYKDWIAPFSTKIATNMESCASPGLYFEVSPTEGIADAMTALFQKAVQQARLTR